MASDQHTVLYGVVGWPIGHSLSPALHNAAFAAAGINAAYLAFPVRDIGRAIAGARALGIRGLSVTIPHKEAIIPHLDKVDELAAEIGAVNTVVNREGRLVGYNTDALGALMALEERISLGGKKCVIVGAGGAARAIGFVLRGRVAAISVANRSSARGRDLAASLGGAFMPMEELSRVAADLLIQTTPVGMAPHRDECPVPESILRPGMAVMDIIYNPLETKLLTMAGSRGCVTISGLSMFVHQGAEQFRLWTNLHPPVEAMTSAVLHALSSGDRE
ncbi:MAG TPA: shikimate dehydrogenase [Syntrophobacteria bacterium]|nr:shikimate dehydrogenase [Syntrophobacteria bacterium]